MSEVYVGAYIKVRKDIKRKSNKKYFCPNNKEHYNGYWDAAFCSRCGAKIAEEIEEFDVYADSEAIADYPSDLSSPLLFGPYNKEYSFLVASKADTGEICYLHDEECEIVLDAYRLKISEEWFREVYQPFLEYLDNQQIYWEIKTGILSTDS